MVVKGSVFSPVPYLLYTISRLPLSLMVLLSPGPKISRRDPPADMKSNKFRGTYQDYPSAVTLGDGESR